MGHVAALERRTSTVDGPLVVVGNASAGGGKRDAIETAVGRLAARRPVEIWWTDTLDDVETLVEAVPPATRVVAAGGDGTFSGLVRAAVAADRTDLELALLPCGTGNDVAGALGLHDLDDAIEVAAGDRVISIDVIDTSCGVAVNAFHLGLGAAAAQRAAAWKPLVGRFAYPLGGLLECVSVRPWDAEVRVDGKTLATGPITMVALSNGWRIGGGLPLAPPARHDDGTIDVIVIEQTDLRQRARLMRSLVTGRHLGQDGVHHRQAETVEIHHTGLPANRDGELIEPGSPLTARIRPAAVRVCVGAR